MSDPRYSPKDVEKIIAALKVLMQTTAVNSYDYFQKPDNGIREKGLLACLKRAIQLTAGMIVLSENHLAESMEVIQRALFECVIWCCWIAQSEENAKYYDEHALKELARIAKNIVRNGYARIYKADDNSEVDPDDYETIFSGQKPHVPKKIKEMAKEVGLDKLYAKLYGFMSLEVHPSNLLRDNIFPDWDRLYVMLLATDGFLRCINLINTNWITLRNPTSQADVRKILGM